MNISYILNNCYSCSVESIKNCKIRSEKLEKIITLIGDIANAGFDFTVRGFARTLDISRDFINKALSYYMYPFLMIFSKSLQETRGRKSFEYHHPEIFSQLHDICKFVEHADKGLQDHIIYIDYTLSEMKEQLIIRYNYSKEDAPCEHTISRILKDYFGYKLTKVDKKQVLKKIPETDEIFSNVKLKFLELELSGDDTIGWSIDDKAKKKLGNISENGKSYAKKEANDHDTEYSEIVTPFGILDLKTNQTYVYCTNNNSTAEFKVDCMEERLKEELTKNPNIKKLMLFLDNGPENNSSRSLWIYKLVELVKKYNIIIELVYYPPYHSKYNKIEHYWGVLQRKWSKEIIKSDKKLVEVINNTKWHDINSQGYYITREYNKGIKIEKNIMNEIYKNNISYRNENIKKWSLIITP